MIGTMARQHAAQTAPSVGLLERPARRRAQPGASRTATRLSATRRASAAFRRLSRRRGLVADVDPLSIAPQPLERVELARLRREDVDDEGEEVHQDPLGAVVALDVRRADLRGRSASSTASAIACTWRVFCPEQSRKKSVNAGVCRRSSTTTSDGLLVERGAHRLRDLAGQSCLGRVVRTAASFSFGHASDLPRSAYRLTIRGRDRARAGGCAARRRRHQAGDRLAAARRRCADRRSTTRPASPPARRKIRVRPAARSRGRLPPARERAAPAPAAAPPARRCRSPGRETTTKFARSSTCGIALPGLDFCERVGAGDEENLRRRADPRAWKRSQRVGGVRRCRGAVSSTSLASSPSTPLTASAVIAKR